MKVDLYNNNDYEEICQWWVDHGMDPIGIKYLGNGFIIKGYAAVFLYTTGTPMCFLENLVTNPHVTKEKRSEAIDLLISTVLKFAKRNGCELIKSVSKIDVVTNRVVGTHGFHAFKEEITFLTKKLTP